MQPQRSLLIGDVVLVQKDDVKLHNVFDGAIMTNMHPEKFGMVRRVYCVIELVKFMNVISGNRVYLRAILRIPKLFLMISADAMHS